MMNIEARADGKFLCFGRGGWIEPAFVTPHGPRAPAFPNEPFGEPVGTSANLPPSLAVVTFKRPIEVAVDGSR